MFALAADLLEICSVEFAPFMHFELLAIVLVALKRK
jgi:hypothetical protein